MLQASGRAEVHATSLRPRLELGGLRLGYIETDHDYPLAVLESLQRRLCAHFFDEPVCAWEDLGHHGRYRHTLVTELSHAYCQ